MTNQTTWKRSLGIILVLALFLTLRGAESILAWGEDWPMSSAVATLTQSQKLSQRSALALASSQRMAAIWSEEDIGAKLCKYDGTWCTSPQLLTASGADTLRPSVAYAGTELLAAWVEGGTLEPSAVVQVDVETLTAQTVITPVYGGVAPKLAVGPDKAHMVFASAPSRFSILQADIYYTSRNLSEATWASPTKVITSGQVTPAGVTGKIFYPEMALSQDGQTIHVVWEQEYSSTRSVWYVTGEWAGGVLTWDPPQRISPVGEHGSRPAIAVDASDQVHVVWGRPEPDYVSPTGQTVLYKKLGTVGDPKQLNDLALQVNDKFPTLAEFSIATGGPSVCVAWHGYYGTEDESDTEEIWMRCTVDGGASWQRGIDVSTSPGEHSLFGNLQLDSSGSAYASWVEFEIRNNEKLPQSLNVRSGPSDLYQVYLPLVMKGS